MKFLIFIYLGMIFFSACSSKEINVAYIDNVKVYKEYKGMEQVTKELEIQQKAAQSNLDTLFNDFQNELKKYEKSRATFSAKEKELSEKLLQQKQEQYQGYKQSVEQKIKEEEFKLTQGVLQKLDGFIKKYAKDKGYTLILGATSSGNIIYAEESMDITNDIIKEANFDYEKKK